MAADDDEWTDRERAWSKKVGDALPTFYDDENGDVSHALVHGWYHEVEDGVDAWSLIMSLVAMATFPIKQAIPEGAEFHAGMKAVTLTENGVDDLPEDSLMLAAMRVVTAAMNDDYDTCNAVVDTVFMRGEDAFEEFMMDLGGIAWSTVHAMKAAE